MDPTVRSILRVIHIMAGVYWAGSTFLMVSVIGPSAVEAAPESGKMMGMVGPRFRNGAIVTGTFSLVTGLILYYYTSGLKGSTDAWQAWSETSTGVWLTAGAVAGIIGFVIGAAFAAPTSGKLLAQGKKIATSGGPPNPEDLAELGRLNNSLTTQTRIVALLFVIAIIGMAAAKV